MSARGVTTLHLAIVLVLGTCVTGAAAEILVPRDHRTIQAAVNAAAAGDAILVDPGTYHERIRMKAGVTLRSAGDDTKGKLGLQRAESTVIDGGGMQGEGAGVAIALVAVAILRGLQRGSQ